MEKVILGRDDRQDIVIGHGGFLGLGEKQTVSTSTTLVGRSPSRDPHSDPCADQSYPWKGSWLGGIHEELEGDTRIDFFFEKIEAACDGTRKAGVLPASFCCGPRETPIAAPPKVIFDAARARGGNG